MSMKKCFMIFATAILMMTSCQTKQTALSDLRRVSQEMELSGQTYTLNDWKNAGNKYYEANRKVAKYAGKYTDEEIQEISRLNGRCVRSFTEGAITKVEGATKLVKSFLEGFAGF